MQMWNAKTCLRVLSTDFAALVRLHSLIVKLKEVVLTNTATLFVFSGLPGSGKTTLAAKLAQHLGITYLRIDSIEAGLKGETEVPDVGRRCYRVAHYIARENLSLGNSVISDSVNPWDLTRTAWNEVATSVGVDFIDVEIVCSNKDEHRSRLESRTTTLPELKDPTWKEVQERDYHPWKQERILIDTSGKTVEACFEELLASLTAKNLEV
jgi:predicted kinase